ncbi:MAG TPA: peptidylprolyl isomerase, partial [Rudaea sp.]|nr:peptidylprolyl isomerase [Rudaea sp.]
MPARCLPPLSIAIALLCATAAVAQAPATSMKASTSAPPTMADVLAHAKPSDWHALDPADTLYLDFARGRVVIELAPAFAPHHVANIEALAREKYFDGLEFLRSQDNYVVQWGDPHADARADDKDHPRPIVHAQRQLKAEFTVPITDKFAFTPLPDRDGYAPQTGFAGDFWAARDPKSSRAWLTHCYGTVGVGRDNDADSGGGTELYVVIASSPRWLDRNITVVGRVVQGMELLSTLPRGSGALGFYEKPEER